MFFHSHTLLRVDMPQVVDLCNPKSTFSLLYEQDMRSEDLEGLEGRGSSGLYIKISETIVKNLVH